MFGIRADGNEWVLFTRGADRATQLVDYVGNVADLIWSSADALWRSFQARVEFFISLNDGSAAVIQPVSKRWPWKPIESQLSSSLAEGGSSQREEEFPEYAAFEDWEALEEAEGEQVGESDTVADGRLARALEMGELSVLSPREQAESSRGWGLYDGLPYGWGQAEADHD
jgi:hypothetical protein